MHTSNRSDLASLERRPNEFMSGRVPIVISDQAPNIVLVTGFGNDAGIKASGGERFFDE